MFKSFFQQIVKSNSAKKQSLKMSTDTLEYASSCVIPTTFKKFPLVGVTDYNHDCKIFDFGLEEGQSLNLPVCACILIRGPGLDGEPAVRPYTPMSPNEMTGKFQLLVKVYEKGAISSYLHGLNIGDEVEFKHIEFNVKIQYPFNKKSITMVCGGTGITPMYQALHRIVNTEGDETEVTMLFGNRTEEDILLKDELEQMVQLSKGRVKVVHVLSNAEWDGETGFVDGPKIEKYGFPPSDDTLLFVCGPPPMYDVLCGPRNEKEVKEGTTLAKLGYNETNVFKF